MAAPSRGLLPDDREDSVRTDVQGSLKVPHPARSHWSWVRQWAGGFPAPSRG